MNISLIPKIELNHFLDGGVTLQTLIDIAQSEGLILPSENKKKLLHFLLTNKDHDISFEKKYDNLVKYCLSTEYGLFYAAYQAVKSAHFDNVRYIEVVFPPQKFTFSGLSAKEVVKQVLKGLKKGEEEFGVIARGVVAVLGSDSYKNNYETLACTAEEFGLGTVGFCLLHEDGNYDLKKHEHLFQLSMSYGVPAKVHFLNPATRSDIIFAFEHLNVTRLSGNLSTLLNMGLAAYLSRNKIMIEVCLTHSPFCDQVDKKDLVPLDLLNNYKVPFSLTAQRPFVNKTDMISTYKKLYTDYKMGIKELTKMLNDSVNYSFLHKKAKTRLMDSIQKDLNNLKRLFKYYMI